ASWPSAPGERSGSTATPRPRWSRRSCPGPPRTAEPAPAPALRACPRDGGGPERRGRRDGSARSAQGVELAAEPAGRGEGGGRLDQALAAGGALLGGHGQRGVQRLGGLHHVVGV